MIKFFCDQCGNEYDPDELGSHPHRRIVRKKGRIKVEVIVAVDSTWNGGHACKSCVLEAVRDGSDVEGG